VPILIIQDGVPEYKFTELSSQKSENKDIRQFYIIKRPESGFPLKTCYSDNRQNMICEDQNQIPYYSHKDVPSAVFKNCRNVSCKNMSAEK